MGKYWLSASSRVVAAASTIALGVSLLGFTAAVDAQDPATGSGQAQSGQAQPSPEQAPTLLGKSQVLATATATPGTPKIVPRTVPVKSQVGPRSTLSPRLALLKDKPVNSALTAAELGLPASGAGSLLKGGGGTVVVTIQGAVTSPASVAALRRAGARVTNIATKYATVTAAIAPADLALLSSVPGVASINEVLTPRLASISPAAMAPMAVSASSNPACAPTTSEASRQLQAAVARSSYGVDGSGVIIGILSDSFAKVSAPTSYAQDVASGNLPGVGNPCGYPTPVELVDDTYGGPGPTDEGRAMAQLVHKVAPGAALKFATALTGELGFAANIRLLAAAGAKVIVDDVAYFAEPMYQDGPVAVAINDVTAAGVSYFTAAGNDNLISSGASVGSLETSTYSTTPCPVVVVSAYAPGPDPGCANFNAPPAADATASYTVPARGPAGGPAGGRLYVNLGWQQPQYGVTTDYDVFVLDAAGTAVLAVGRGNNLSPSGTNKSAELAFWANPGDATTVNVVVAKFTGPDVGFKYILLPNFPTTTAEYATSNGDHTVGPSIYGHAGAASAVAVAAAPYNSDTTPEVFSSRGPVTHYFGPVTSSTPASAITAATIAKPDVTATDGDCTTFFAQVGPGGSCPYRFYGTSAAAPNVAAVDALLRDANPNLTVSARRTLLTANASAMSGGAATSTGAGLVNANAAIGASPRVPRAPGAPTVAGGVGVVQVSFSPPTIVGSSAIDRYTVSCSASGGATGTVSGPSSPITVSGLTVGGSYSCTVSARNAVGDGPVSSASNVVAVAGAPAAPVITKLKRVKPLRQIIGRIAPTNMNGLAALSYQLTCTKFRGHQGFSRSGRSATPKVIVRRLANSAKFRCRARVRNAAGWSPPSRFIAR